jgi:monothiol glutaredoxin
LDFDLIFEYNNNYEQVKGKVMTETTGQKTFDHIKELTNNNDVVLFMKGDANFPQCGFSAVVSNILQKLGIKFKDVNILLDPELRQGIKEYSDWPTIPQLYVKGEFLGGCDIIKEMYESGELQQVLAEKKLIAKDAS